MHAVFLTFCFIRVAILTSEQRMTMKPSIKKSGPLRQALALDDFYELQRTIVSWESKIASEKEFRALVGLSSQEGHHSQRWARGAEVFYLSFTRSSAPILSWLVDAWSMCKMEKIGRLPLFGMERINSLT